MSENKKESDHGKRNYGCDGNEKSPYAYHL